MIRIALCNDEQNTLEKVSLFIEKCAQMKNRNNLEIFHSANGLKNALDDDKSFDIFVLDVYIGDEKGMALAKCIRKQGIESSIVFLTTDIEYAPESFETSTLRYLLEPIDPAKFYEVMDAVLSLRERIWERLVKLKTGIGVENVNVNRIVFS